MLFTFESRLFGAPSARLQNSSARFLFERLCLAVLVALVFSTLASSVIAVPINYGSFQGTDVQYLNVQEDANSPPPDAPPLFGEPDTVGPVTPGYPSVPCVLCTIPGNTLDFTPTGFSASSVGAVPPDITDGNLSFTILANQGKAIKSIDLSEAGDVTMAGIGTDLSRATVAAYGVINIVDVDGAQLVVPVSIPFNLAFTPFGGVFLYATNGGGGPVPYHATWSGSLSEDLELALNSNSVPYTLGATRVTVNLDNVLSATSEANTFVVIAKKEFAGLSFTVEVIPEPATWSLIVLGALAGLGVRRTRS